MGASQTMGAFFIVFGQCRVGWGGMGWEGVQKDAAGNENQHFCTAEQKRLIQQVYFKRHEEGAAAAAAATSPLFLQPHPHSQPREMKSDFSFAHVPQPVVNGILLNLVTMRVDEC